MALLYDGRTAKANSVRYSLKVIEEIALIEMYIAQAVFENKLRIDVNRNSTIEINGTTVTGTQITDDISYHNVWQGSVDDDQKSAEMQTIINYFETQLRYSISRYSTNGYIGWRIGW